MKKTKTLLIIIIIAICVYLMVACDGSFVGLDSDRLSSESSNTNTLVNSLIAPSANYEVIINTVSPTIIEGGLTEVVSLTKDTVVSISCTIGSEGNSSGSGVFFAEDKDKNFTFVITCCHVIDNATTIKAIKNDGTELDCLLIGGDDEKDIAVLRVNGTHKVANIRNLSSEDGEPLKLAESVYAIGNPLGTLGGSVTQGIISGTERIINMDGVSMNLLQIDVAVNPGNSGGALFDYYGTLVGIVNAKSVGADVEGIGYAIKIDDAINDANALLQTAGNPEFQNLGYIEGKVRLGVTVQGEKDGSNFIYIIQSLNLYGSVARHNATATNDNRIEVQDKITGIKKDSQTFYFEDINTLGNFIKALNVGDSITLIISHRTSSTFFAQQYITREITITMNQYVYGL